KPLRLGLQPRRVASRQRLAIHFALRDDKRAQAGTLTIVGSAGLNTGSRTASYAEWVSLELDRTQIRGGSPKAGLSGERATHKRLVLILRASDQGPPMPPCAALASVGIGSCKSTCHSS